MAKSKSIESLLFDYHTLRLSVGGIAIGLPAMAVYAWWVIPPPITSISSLYYTDLRNVFVGVLFALATLFWAYNGHPPENENKTIWDKLLNIFTEKVVSKIGAVAAVATALSPTACSGCGTSLSSSIHMAAALTLVASIVYFCLVPFRKSAKAKEASGRALTYTICGLLMIVGIVGRTFADVLAWEIVVSVPFGAAWIVAGVYHRFDKSG